MVFTFGKYAGYALSDIPASYLAKAVEEYTMPEILMCQCRAELLRRFAPTGIEVFAEEVPAEDIDLRVRIRRVYREMANKHHPDKGGSHDSMQAINDFYQALTL